MLVRCVGFQKAYLLFMQEHLESQVAELKAQHDSRLTQQQQWAEQEQQLRAQLNSAKEQLSKSLADAKQQQQQDQTYQDELVADKHQAMQVQSELCCQLLYQDHAMSCCMHWIHIETYPSKRNGI